MYDKNAIMAQMRTTAMSWSIRALFGLSLLMMLWVLVKPPQRLPQQAHDVATEQTNAQKITVYQSSGSHGEAHFSDDATRGRARVVDLAKGTTFHSTYGGKVPQTASVSYDTASLDPIERLRQQNMQLQQAAQDIHRQQMDRVIDR
jgi:hypothetical protein